MVTDLLRSRPAAAAAAGGFLVRRAAACAEVFLPAAPPVVAVSGGAPIWTPGAWVSLGSRAEVLVPSYYHVVNFFSAGGLVDSSVEFSRGDGHTPLDCFREISPVFNPGVDTTWSLPLSGMSRPVAVPANEVVYARLTVSSATVYQVEVMLVGWAGGLPTFDTIPLAVCAGPGRWYPANATSASVVTTSGAGWGYGTPVTVVDPAPNDMLVVGIEVIASAFYLTDPAAFYQLGYGAAGSETWCATLTHGRTWTTRWVWPPVLVRAGERLAVRTADAAATGRNCRVKVYDL